MRKFLPILFAGLLALGAGPGLLAHDDAEQEGGSAQPQTANSEAVPSTLEVRQDLEATVQLLEENGIDLSDDIDAATTNCEVSVSERWESETDKFKSQNSPEDLKETCVLNASMDIYSAALNQLNTDRQSTYEAEMAAYEQAKLARLDKIAADKAAYEAEVAAQKKAHDEAMAKWKREAELCKSGQKKYCAK